MYIDIASCLSLKFGTEIERKICFPFVQMNVHHHLIIYETNNCFRATKALSSGRGEKFIC